MGIAVKAAAIGVTGSILALLLRRSVPELSLLVSLAAGLAAASLCIGVTAELTAAYENLAEKSGVSTVLLTPVVKCVGIALVTQLGAQLCRDASQGAAAAFVELCGTLCALYVALPLISSLVSVVEGLV